MPRSHPISVPRLLTLCRCLPPLRRLYPLSPRPPSSELIFQLDHTLYELLKSRIGELCDSEDALWHALLDVWARGVLTRTDSMALLVLQTPAAGEGVYDLLSPAISLRLPSPSQHCQSLSCNALTSPSLAGLPSFPYLSVPCPLSSLFIFSAPLPLVLIPSWLCSHGVLPSAPLSPA